MVKWGVIEVPYLQGYKRSYPIKLHIHLSTVNSITIIIVILYAFVMAKNT